MKKKEEDETYKIKEVIKKNKKNIKKNKKEKIVFKLNKELEKPKKEILNKSGELSFLEKLKSFSLFLYFFIFLIVISIFIWTILFFQGENKPLVCGDGTFYGSCSLEKPYYCFEGNLIQDSYHCGCNENMIKTDIGCRYVNFTKNDSIKLKYYLKGEESYLEFETYSGVSDYLDSIPIFLDYEYGEVTQRSDFKKIRINNEIQNQILLPLVMEIKNKAPESIIDQARIAISLVQHIPYGDFKTKEVLGVKMNVSRYPYQVLEDQIGACEGKSDLLIYLLDKIGYETAFFYYSLENHEAVGIKCPMEFSLHNSGYCFIETTSPVPISYSSGVYLGSGNGRLYSSPEIIPFSKGLSLPNNLEEYSDSRKLENALKNKNNFFGLFSQNTLNKIKLKYGII